MRYTENELRTLFQKQYNRTTWTNFLKNFMEGARLRSIPEEFHTASDNEKGFFLGDYNTSDHYRIGLFQFDINTTSIARKRVGLRNLVKSLINPNWGEFDAALAVFASNSDWRLSFICDIKEEKTAPKRFTYVFGDKGMLYRTPVERLFGIQDDVTFASLRKAFSVKELSDEFFDEYREIYADFVQYITGNRYVKKTQGSGYELRSFPGQPQNKAFYEALGKDDKRARDFVKKMMGRITFLYFLQQKGWMCGDKNYMLHLFESSSDKDYYLKKVLVPLFFGVLNTKPKDRKSVFAAHGWNESLREAWETIPYLNGGLFEPDGEDIVVDRCATHIFRKKDFDNLFEFFGRYNFTIDENDPTDAEVGVDPEMLGKIFESLLEDNKDKGAFYTPKEIVTFMCQEALISYLKNRTGLEESSINAFVINPEDNVSSFSESQKYDLLEAIIDVKICDPAIGSGAFPMGMLNELVACRMALLGEKGNRAEVKHEIIHNNIYGVDIEKGAVDIARLRFWLSLVVDEDSPSPLPNLDYKIMQGNSLLERYKNVDLSHLIDEHYISDDIFEQEDYELKERLNSLLGSYYGCSDHTRKAEMQVEIERLIHRQMLGNGGRFPNGTNLNINVSSNNEFFLWHTWFGDVFRRGGFDICIGNPPYIRQEKLDHSYKQLLCSLFPDVGYGTADILVYFFGLGLNILAPDGELVFITSNKYLKTQYGLSIRNHFAQSVDVDFIIDFFELPVFNASTDAAITKLTKKAPTRDTRYFPILSLQDLDLMSTIEGEYQVVVKENTEWKFINPEELSILRKLDSDAIPLLEFVNGRLYRGITTGSNDSFILSSETRNEILDNCESVEEWLRTDNIIKKAFKSRYIRKYNYEGPETWLLFIPWHFPIPFEEAERMDPENAIAIAEGRMIKEYPAVYNYLQSHYDDLASRNAAETGIRYEWYALQRWGAKYYKEFDEHKLIYIHTAINHEFYFDTEQHYVNNSCYIIVTDSKYLYAFLNSSLFRYYKKIKFVAYGNGAENGRCKLDGNKMQTVPIRVGVNEDTFAPIVDQLIRIKKENPSANVSHLEREVDRLLYEIYGFSEDEIEIIEGNC